jgi:hypothetical protein
VRSLIFMMMLTAACGSSPGVANPDLSGDGGGGDGGAGGYVFHFETVSGCAGGGFQNQIAAGPSGMVGLVTQVKTTMTATCMLAMGGTSQVPIYNLCYGESAAGAAFQTSTAASPNYNALTGVGLGISSSGETFLAYTGGMHGALYCGGSQLMAVKKPAGGSFGAEMTLAPGSQSGGLNSDPTQSGHCTQGVCNSGDVTGQWPSVAYDSSGTPSVAFRDVHFGFAMTDFSRSDVEFIRGGEFLTVDVAFGGGEYNKLVYDPAGRAVVAHYNSAGGATESGIWVEHESSATLWSYTKVSPAVAGEQLGFAVSPAGVYGLAYYDRDRQRLSYLESSDGMTWQAPVDIDVDGNTGMYPSLAFAPDGEPAVSYYRCNEYNPNSSNCDPNHDGLHYARRSGGNWATQVVQATGEVTDGLYTSLVFSAGKAVIAFGTQTFDPGTGTTQSQLVVAREQ